MGTVCTTCGANESWEMTGQAKGNKGPRGNRSVGREKKNNRFPEGLQVMQHAPFDAKTRLPLVKGEGQVIDVRTSADKREQNFRTNIFLCLTD
jgi:hypothetical protein